MFLFLCLMFAKQDGDPRSGSYDVVDLSHIFQEIMKYECSQSYLNFTIKFNVLGNMDIRLQLDALQFVSFEFKILLLPNYYTTALINFLFGI